MNNIYPYYIDYQLDWREKIMKAVQWAVDNGYKSGFLEEYVFEYFGQMISNGS